MAAIYSGIHLKLKSPHTPWTDKLKLARFAWISPQCFLPNKEQVLFDWTSHALTLFYSKKIDLAQEVVEGLWVYFDDIIHSKKLQNVLSQGKTISLRITVAQVINDRILEHSSGQPSAALATVLSCLRGILSSPVLSVTYTAKYELLGELLARLSHLACSRLSPQHSGEPLPAHELEVLLLTLGTYLTVQKQQANTNRVFTQVTTHLLQPLVVLRHLLSARAWAEEDGSEVRLRQQVSREIRSKVDSVLQVALFFPDNLQSYKDELMPSSTEEPMAGRKGRGGKGLPSPLSTILEKLRAPGSFDPAVLYSVLSTSLPLLFKFALDTFCKGDENKLLCFHLMTKFVCALDFTNDLIPRETFDTGNWNLVLLALENLLNSCLSGDIYNVAADRIQHGEVQLKFYRCLTQLLFNNAQTTTPAWYRCLKTLLALNHMIVEPDLDELVSSVWVDSDCMEPRVCKAREALISATLNTYAKLRQLPRLFGELLSVVCRPAMDEMRPPLLSEAVGKTLTLCLMDTPISQSLELCKVVLERLQSDVLTDAQKQDATDAALKMFSLSTLLHVLFFGLKTLDNATPLPVVRQTQRLMAEMLLMLKPLLEWLRDVPPSGSLWGQKVREASLLLTYTWVEVDALYQMHCSKYSLFEDAGSSEVKDEGLWLLSEALVKDWDQTALEVYNPIGQLFQKFLALQMIKKILLKNNFATDGISLDVLHKATRFIVGKDELSPTQLDQLWDLQISSVDAESYPAAHWYLVMSNLALVAPFLTQEDVAHVASLLLKGTLSVSAEKQGDEQGLSVAIISKQLLDSVILIELPFLHSAVVRRIMQSVTQICDAQRVGNVCLALLKADEEFSNEGCDLEATTDEAVDEGGADLAVRKRLECAAQQISTALASRSLRIDLSAAQVDDIASLLRVSSALNVDGMSVKDYAELFLITFLIATCTQPCGDVEVSTKVALLRDTYCLLTSLLTGGNAQFILKLAHGSKLLEGAVTSLVSLANHGLFEHVSDADWSSVLQAVRCFLRCLLQLIIQRKSSVRLNLEQFTSFLLAQGEAASSAAVTAATPAARHVTLQLSLASLDTVADVMTSSLGKSKQLDETLVQLLGRILAVTGAVVQVSLSSGTAVRGTAGQAFSVDVVAGMVRSELACLSHQAEEPQAETPSTLLHMGLYRSCGQQVLKELCPAPRPMDFLLSSLHFLPAYYSAVERTIEPGIKDVFVDILHNVHKLLSASWLSQAQLQQLLTPVKDLIGQLVATSSLEQFHPLLLLLREDLEGSKVTEGNHRKVFSAVTITGLLASCELPESCSKAFWLIAPQIISALVFIVRVSGKEPSLISTLTIPTLEALSMILRHGEGLLSNPHHVTIALGATQFVSLEHLSAQDYHAAFEAIHEVLFAIIQCHKQVMLASAPAFLKCFYRLVASIILEGKQRGEVERASEQDSVELVKCARLVERMYSHIAATAEGFTVLSSFIVAQYVSELQKVTLRPEIKAHLMEGIYSILDLCAARDMKFLSSALPQGLREVFSELYGTYQHYHKAQRQGEDKYTA